MPHHSRAVFACVVCVMLLGGVQQVAAASLTVAWDQSSDSTVAGYRVWYGTESHNYTTSVMAGTSTSVTLTGLAEATIYYVVVQAYNSQGIFGELSSEVAGQVLLSAPSISCPSPVLTSPDGKPIPVTLLAVASGGVQPLTIQCSPASGSLFSVGTTSFSCTAVDTIQQKASCTSTVVVLAPSSPTPPPTSPTPALTIACPVIQPVTASGNAGKAIVKFADPVVSGGKAPVTASCTPRSGSQFAIGTTTVSCRATDALQQVAACTTSATVLAPTVQEPPKGKK